MSKKQRKKIALWIPPKHQGGFLNNDDVVALEKLLRNDPSLEFIGNVDIQNVSIIDGCPQCKLNQLTKNDLFLWYAPRMKKQQDILLSLAKRTRVIKNPHTCWTVEDKFSAHATLSNADVPVAQYALLHYIDFDNMKKILKDWNEIIVKPRHGSYGRGIIRISDFETLRDIAGLSQLQARWRSEYIYIEKFYPHHREEWISVVVLNYKTLYGYRKKASSFKSWKVYDAKKAGGNAEYADPSAVSAIAEKAARALQEPIICFDIIKTESGYKIIDENNFPGLYPEILSGINTSVARAFYTLIKDTYK